MWCASLLSFIPLSDHVTGLLTELTKEQSSKCKIFVVDEIKLELKNLTHIASICVICLVMFINECAAFQFLCLWFFSFPCRGSGYQEN